MIEYIAGLKTSVEVATTIAKTVKDIDRNVSEAEYKAQLAELILALSETHLSMAELNSILIDKDKTISKLQSQLEMKDNIVYEDPVYWKTLVDGTKEGPYCQKCYDDNKKLVRLLTFSADNEGAWKCSVCESFFNTKEYARRRRENNRRIVKNFTL